MLTASSSVLSLVRFLLSDPRSSALISGKLLLSDHPITGSRAITRFLLPRLLFRHHERLFFYPVQPRHRHGIQCALWLLLMFEEGEHLALRALRLQLFRHFL